MIDRSAEALRDLTRHSPKLREGAKAVAGLCRARLELLLLDLEEEKERIEQRLVMTAVAAFLFGLGSLGATAFFVALLWSSLGMWAIALFAFLYLTAAAGVVVWLRRQHQSRHRTFECTLKEFEKDAERFAGVFSGDHSDVAAHLTHRNGL